MVKDTTLYDRLEVPSDASESQIKKSFIHLSKKYHPDKHTDEEKESASEKFKSITEAKEILLDTEKRSLYDQIGMDILNQNQNQQQNGFPFPGGFPGGFPGFPGFPGFNFNVNQGQQMQERRVDPITISIKVRLDQVYKGDKINLNYTCYKHCEPCNGDGGKLDVCNECQGKGKRVQIQQMGHMITQSISDCHPCQGRGKKVREACKKCDSKGTVDLQKNVSITLSPLMSSGDKVKMERGGHQFKQTFSDLIISIEIESHPIFKRNGDKLMMKLELTLYEALFGFTRTIKYIDDTSFTIESSTKTDYHTVKYVSEKNLCILFVYTLPLLKNVEEIVPTYIEENLKTVYPLVHVSNQNEVILAFLNSK